MRLDCKKDEKSARLNVSPLALYPLNDMQLQFGDTSRTSERIKRDLDASFFFLSRYRKEQTKRGGGRKKKLAVEK